MKNPLYFVSVLWVSGRPASAMLLSTESVQTQLDRAVSVVELQIESKWADEDPVFGFRWTAAARVSRVIEERPDGRPLPEVGDTIRLHGIGGEANGVGVILNGYPRPFVGKRYQAYLQRDGSDFSIAGFEAGFSLLGESGSFLATAPMGATAREAGHFCGGTRIIFRSPILFRRLRLQGSALLFRPLSRVSIRGQTLAAPA
ncbi:MAG: hypothetical protein R3B54_01080 [Bdellovibrionota bacterium]